MLKLEILDPKTQLLFQQLAKKGFPFPLAGGTALSLHLGHRISVDLDFVVHTSLSSKDIQVFRQIAANYEIVYSGKEQINLFIDGVKITLFSYPWKELFPVQTYKKLKICDIRDVLVSKALTIGRREEIKDYIDIYFALKSGVLSFPKLLTLAKKRFGGDFSEKLFLKQLLLVKDIEYAPITFIKDKVSANEMYRFFAGLVEGVLAT